MLNLLEMSEAAKIARGILQGGEEFIVLIEVWVDEVQQQTFCSISLRFPVPFAISPTVFFV